MGQEFVEPGNGVIGDTSEHVAEPGEGIDVNLFADVAKLSRIVARPATVIAAEERPVVRLGTRPIINRHSWV